MACVYGDETDTGERGQLAVTTEWLAEQLDDQDLVLLHVGEDSAYEREHIPGARYVRMPDILLRRAESGLRNELPSPERLRDALQALGISDDSRIVVYWDGDWVIQAARLALTLDYMGLGQQTSVLDGGMPLWKEEGRPLTTETPAVQTGKLTRQRLQDMFVDADWVADHLQRPGYALVDARSAALYDGERTLDGTRAGRIPGAGSIPYGDILDEAQRLRSRQELQALFEQAGVAPGDSIVGYCHTGMVTALMLLAARTLGYPILLYDGSFEEWGADPERPVEGS
jgi:thiosulfate/3-mercaptopyruvate sulfurtransferase